MTTSEAFRLAVTFTYKPGVSLEVCHRFDENSLNFSLRQCTKNANEPSSDFRNGMSIMITSSRLAHMNGDDLKREVFHMIMAFEDHEAREWFRDGGECIFPPHEHQGDKVKI